MVRWVVQLNLGKDGDAQCIKEACKLIGQPCDMLKIIPFSETLPNVPSDMPTVFYGGTNWINAIHRSGIWSPGAFFDEENFLYTSAQKHYGERLMNYDAKDTTFKEFVDWAYEENVDDDALFFIRPLRDMKEFHGDVIRYADFHRWYNNISHGGYSLTENTRIMVGEPFGISHEWRCFIVNGKVSSCSHYRSYRELDVYNADDRTPVKGFAENMAALWSPSDVFVMDVGMSNGVLYVIENNCVNSSGFYACNIEKVVEDITEHVIATY